VYRNRDERVYGYEYQYIRWRKEVRNYVVGCEKPVDGASKLLAN